MTLRRIGLWVGIPALVSVLVLLAGGWAIGELGGAWSRSPSALATVSPAAQALIDAAYADIDAERLVDHHVHVVGLGTGGTGAWVNPDMRSWLSPIRRVRFEVYASASGIEDLSRADAQYVERLHALIDGLPEAGRFLIFAFDHHYEPDGAKALEHSEFYIPNRYVFELAEAHAERFVPVMSVNPYRPDALAELERWAERGGAYMKWLPNAMGMDPADPALDPFYERMAELDVTLISHAGVEKAVEAEADQELGNPLRLRRALEHGVRVVVPHCASLGASLDLDDPDRPSVPAFDLFMRMMDNPRWEGLLFGEVSAMTQANRLGEPLTTLLERTDLHPRLVSGSDYPLPAINVVIRTGALEGAGYITPAEREALDEIYEVNPLLFDFVLKRTVRAPTNGAAWPAEVFDGLPK